MNIRKMKRWQKIVVANVFAVFMMADSLVASAHTDVYHVENEQTEIVTADAAIAAESFCAHADGCENHMFEVLYDAEFVDENGTIIPVSDIRPNVFCFSHNWVFGYFQSHLKDNKGGCNTDVYTSYLCTRCNTIKIEDWCESHYYSKCPH